MDGVKATTLIVSFDKIDEHHICDDVRNNIRHIAIELSVMFEVERRTSELQKSKGLFS